MLSKRCTKLKEVDGSGAAAGPINKALKALEELNYLSRLFPFLKVHKTKRNPYLAKEGGEEAFYEYQYEDKQNNKDKNNEDKTNEVYNDEVQYKSDELENFLKISTEAEKQDTISETKIDRKNGKNKIES